MGAALTSRRFLSKWIAHCRVWAWKVVGAAAMAQSRGNTIKSSNCMPLPACERLGRYEISGKIRAGEMGEAYCAREPRVSREVAIKVSAEHFTDRFEREAHSMAVLNHPNICILYDIGRNYLVKVDRWFFSARCQTSGEGAQKWCRPHRRLRPRLKSCPVAPLFRRASHRWPGSRRSPESLRWFP